ncbi:TPA: tetratricopeptide repeat protein [Bacillus pacificus]|nr:tetratricopeptide repeat protein [Bacillus pacificus]
METRGFTHTGYDLLIEWYHQMVSQHTDKAITLKQVIDKQIDSIKELDEIFDYYTLFNFRFEMLQGNFENDLNDLARIQERPDSRLQYYYHLFNFIYATEVGQYTRAEYHMELAESLLPILNDELETAEFHYRLSLYYYYLAQATLSVNYANKALDYFSNEEGYDIKAAACVNTLGMASITLGQFDMAEEYLVDALNTFQRIQAPEIIILKVRYNLGLMYADQGLSELAIRHLNEVYESFPTKDKVNYVKLLRILAREHIHLQQNESASPYIEEGLKICNKEYYYHFTILNNINNSIPAMRLEEIMSEAIPYFKEQELWNDVIIYTELLGNQWYNMGEKEKACDCYRESLDARKQLNEKGSLK